ncbi:hypothetical protein NDU88_000352 [Pleurodeles waltl]|uniref:Uncharacterized protein n=1 Tax=Pleurodeles waltl TaxID=8319 RepID=A0AAV7LW22_PLEWA|nr:hypothetical protein NDU88_000352 [Pleurodeles waltl]
MLDGGLTVCVVWWREAAHAGWWAQRVRGVVAWREAAHAGWWAQRVCGGVKQHMLDGENSSSKDRVLSMCVVWWREAAHAGWCAQRVLSMCVVWWREAAHAGWWAQRVRGGVKQHMLDGGLSACMV